MTDPALSPPPLESDGDGAPLDRRSLLTHAAGLAGAATVATFWFDGLGDPSRRARLAPTAPDAPRQALTDAEYSTLAAALDRMLPSGGPEDPGARDVNSIGYLDAILASPEIEDEPKRVIREGAVRLDEAARTQGAASFAALPPDAQDLAIRAMETTDAGRMWLRRTVTFTLESFLGDPIYGGNVGMAGWRWAAHKPGTPRPRKKA